MTHQHIALIRCDATEATGLGHLSRCLGLAEALEELGAGVRLIGRFSTTALRMLEQASVRYATVTRPAAGPQGAAETAKVARSAAVDIIVVDSYDVDAPFVSELRSSGAIVVLVDDFASLPRYDCAAVINSSARALNLSYPDSRACYLIGPRYALLRRALRSARPRSPRAHTGRAARVLITTGGVDGLNMTPRLLRILASIAPDLAVHAVCSSSYARLPDVQDALRSFEASSRVSSDLRDLSGAMTSTDLVLCAGGLTKYEAAYLGIPAGALSANDGQAQDSSVLESLGACVDLGLAEQVTDDAIARQLERLVASGELRAALAERSFAMFPTDPTLDAARKLLSLVGNAARAHPH